MAAARAEPADEEGFDKYRRLILANFERLTEEHRELRAAMAELDRKLTGLQVQQAALASAGDLAELKVEMAKVGTKANLMSGVISAVGSVVISTLGAKLGG